MQEDNCCIYYQTDESPTIEKNNLVLPSGVLKMIVGIAKKNDFDEYSVNCKKVNANGNSYTAILYEIDIKGITADGEKETNLFIKYAINNTCQKYNAPLSEVYQKESYFYKDLPELFIKLQNDANIPIGERYNTPKCFDANSQAIILENLSKKGFKTFHRKKVMSLAFAELSIQQLAKFHGLFYILKEKNPEYFNNNFKVMKYPFILKDDSWKDFITNACEASYSFLNEDLKEKIKRFVPKIFDLFPKYMDDSAIGSTICHGEYRITNILAKEMNGDVSKVIPVDYQTLYYGCPVNDILNFVYTGSDYEFRKKHLSTLKVLYYETLTTFLNYFLLDINKILPKKEFERQFVDRRDYGLIVTLYNTPFIYSDDKHIPDSSKDDFTEFSFVMDSRFRERIQDVVDEFVELGSL